MKILFIAGHEFLEKQDNGGRQCSYRNYTLLCDMFGEKSVFLCMFSNTSKSDHKKNIHIFPTHRSKLEQIKNTLLLQNGYDRKTKKVVLNYIKELEPDLLFFDFSITGSLIRLINAKSKTVVFLHNVEKNYMWNKVKHEGVFYLLPFFCYYYNEAAIVKRADKVICLNGRDSALLKQSYGRKADFLMPMTFVDQYSEEEAKRYQCEKKEDIRLHLLFVGSLFAPNFDGLLWFIKNVMIKLPYCHLTVVGKDMEKKKDILSRENVTIAGTVEDLSVYYYRADAVVIPILYGDGMKIKTAEAMMYGKPIFGTNEAFEGYDIKGTKGIWECNGSEEFVSQIENYRVNYQVELCKSINRDVRRLFLEKYEMRKQEMKCRQFFDSLMGEQDTKGQLEKEVYKRIENDEQQ